MAGWFSLFALMAIGAVLKWGGDGRALAAFDGADALFAVLALACAILTIAALAQGRKRGFLNVLRDAASWLLLFAALAAGYNFREDLLALGARVVAEVAPVGSLTRLDTQTDGEQAVRIRRRPDGHFMAQTSLNGMALPMLVDTGASMVVLRPVDAQKLGINVSKLQYTVSVQTANGTAFAAPIRLRNVRVGPIHFDTVDALVAKPGTLRDSLLGMSFLNRLRSYEFSGDFLTLRI